MVAEELKVRVSADTRDAEQGLSNVKSKSASAGSSMDDASGSASGFGASLRKFGPQAAAAAAAIGVIADQARRSLDAWSELEMAHQRMSAAVEVSGENAEEIIPQYEELASNIQDITTVSDGAAMEMISLAQSMGVTSRDMDQVIRGAVGISRTFGINTQRAIRGVTEAMQGNFTLLQRYIPQIREAEDEAEKLAIVQETMADSFSMAEAETETYQGSLEQLANSWSDLREEQGRFLAELAQPLIDWADEFVSQLSKQAQYINDLREANEAVDEGTASEEQRIDVLEHSLEREEARLSQMERLADQQGVDVQYTEEQIEAQQSRVQEIQNEISALRRLEGVNARLAAHRDEMADQEREEEERIQELLRLQSDAAERQEDWRREQLSDAERQLEAYKDEWSEIVNVRDALRDAGEEYAVVQQRINTVYAEKQRLRNEIRLANLETVDLTRSVEQEAQSFDELADSVGDTRSEIMELRPVYEDTYDALTQAGEEATRQREQEHEFLREDFDRMTEGNIAAIRRQADEFREAGVDQVEVAQWMAGEISQAVMGYVDMLAGPAMSLTRELMSLERSRHQEKIDNLNRELDDIERRHEREVAWAEATGASEEEISEMKARQTEERHRMEEERDQKEAELKRKQFEREQQMSIAQAIMNTAQAVTNVLANMPPPANIAMAGAIAAMGWKEVSAIRQQSPPALEKGGSFVTDGPQMFLAGEGQSPRERVTVEPLSGPYSNSAGGNITVNVSGVIGDREKVAEWVHEAIRRGQERGKVRA